MKKSAIFVNTARGAIVDEPALLDALTSGRIAGAGLDVFTTEPLPPGHPLTQLSNVVITPHCAGVTPEALEAGLANGRGEHLGVSRRPPGARRHSAAAGP